MIHRDHRDLYMMGHVRASITVLYSSNWFRLRTGRDFPRFEDFDDGGGGDDDDDNDDYGGDDNEGDVGNEMMMLTQ
jgi:hypothetical protein